MGPDGWQPVFQDDAVVGPFPSRILSATVTSDAGFEFVKRIHGSMLTSRFSFATIDFSFLLTQMVGGDLEQ